MPKTQEELIEEYKSQLSEQEKLVLNIAVEHLETSFDISKSIGYKSWLAGQDAGDK
tara:strand:+ start:394 stop:561 length:168 start_codon:yes stop_codon:yes gene_type:complete